MKLCFFLFGLFFSIVITAKDTESINALQKQISQAVESKSTEAAESMAAQLLTEKFKIGAGADFPEWFTEYYPIPSEMDPDQNYLPRLKFQFSVPSSVSVLAPLWEATRSRSSASDTSCSVKLSPPTPLFSVPNDNPLCRLDAKEFLIDRSELASLEKAPPANKYQEGYISIPKLEGLTEVQKQNLMAQTTFSLPKSTSSVDPIKVKIRKLVAHDDYPLALGKIEVQVGSTLAQIPVDLPPVPDCKIVPSPGFDRAFSPGETAQVELHVDSIFLDGEVSPDGFVTSQRITAGRQLVSSIGTMRKAGTFSFVVPQNPWPGNTIRDGIVNWSVDAEVVGVTNHIERVNCAAHTFEVIKALPPKCSLTANPMNLSQGQTTQLTLSCVNRVTSATIDGVSVSLNSSGIGTSTYTKKAKDGIETVMARAIGPGGTSEPQVNLNSACPLADPYYKYVYDGRTFVRGGYRYVAGKICSRFGCSDRYLKTFGFQYADWFPSPWGCAGNSYCINSMWETGQGNHRAIQVGPADSPNCAVTRYVVRDSGCFSKNTHILMADGYLKPVSEVQDNDLVFNPHYRAPVRVKKVVKGPEKKALYEVVLGNSRLEVTEDHPFYTQRGWLQAIALKKGDKLLGEGSGKVVSATRQMKYSGPKDVWNFELDTDDPMGHIVIANGIPTGDLTSQIEIRAKKQMNP